MNERRKQTYVYGNIARNIDESIARKQAKNTAQKKSTKLSTKKVLTMGSRNASEAAVQPRMPVKREVPKKVRKTSGAKVEKGSRERISVVSFAIFLIGMIVIFKVFFDYIEIHTGTLKASAVLSQKEQALQKLKSENDEKEDSLNSKVELQKIYEIATTQYGMVHANENQIIVYKKNESEYIKQNEDIPTQ